MDCDYNIEYYEYYKVSDTELLLEGILCFIS